MLVTGAAGFLGRALCDELRKRGAEVCGVDNAVTPTGEHTGVEQCSCVDYQTAWRLATWRPTHIIHAAGIASPYWYSRLPLETIDVSVAGTRNMLDVACLCRARMLYMSSSEVYGDPEVIPTPETYIGRIDQLGERACYDVGKMMGETLCSVYAREHGADVVIARPFNVYGPGMSDQDYRLMAEIRRAKRERRSVRLFGTGEHTRTFCYIDDAVEGLLTILERGRCGEPYNVGKTSPEISCVELADLAGVFADIVPYPNEYTPHEPSRRCPDITKLRALGYHPKVTLEEGLKRFLCESS